jgi:hypothetical protein
MQSLNLSRTDAEILLKVISEFRGSKEYVERLKEADKIYWDRNAISLDREDAEDVFNEDARIENFKEKLEAIAAPAQQAAE